MKEINLLKQDEVKLHGERQVEKKTVITGTEQLRPGHKCFEIDTTTLAVSEAKYEREIHFNQPDRLKVIERPGCAYINAMNSKNALKVYKKGGRKVSKPFMSLSDVGFI